MRARRGWRRKILNGDFGGQVDSGFAQGLLDRFEESRRGVV